jgi:phage shock protein C
MNIKNKKLYRSSENKILFGVLGGIGEYLEVDPALVRAVFVFLSMFVFFWPSVITYIILMLIIPKKRIAEKVEAKEEVKTEAI